ncbi:hypothetical protein PENNAL_c0285G11834, partial [Penicillium nalgiovense]
PVQAPLRGARDQYSSVPRRARISLLDFDLLLLVIVVTRSGGASRSQ